MKMENLNDSYGGFIVSKNILKGVPIRYSFRQESKLPVLNGWHFYSVKDDDDYINNPQNFYLGRNSPTMFQPRDSIPRNLPCSRLQ